MIFNWLGGIDEVFKQTPFIIINVTLTMISTLVHNLNILNGIGGSFLSKPEIITNLYLKIGDT